jgi:catechol 2,3-dioxygenase-like lactoylglutathione lyase family enzyme
MSGDGSLTLDHVALVSPDLSVSKEDYEKLGFRLTAESSHMGKLSPDGPVELWGSGNRCAMFRQGYYEILGVTDPHRSLEHFRALADKFHGVQIVALGCERAADLYKSRKDRVKGLKEPVEIGRDVPHGEGTKPGLFRIVHVEPDVFPEAEILFIEHTTPDVLWQKSLLDHPNGVRSLEGITLCSDEPERTAERFRKLTLREPDEKNGLRFSLDEGFVAIATPDGIADRFEDAVLPAIPCVAVVTLGTTDLDQTRGLLKENGITPHAAADGVWVRPERAGGVVLHFVASGGS